MSVLRIGPAAVRRLLKRGVPPTCFVCQGLILPSEDRLRLRGETFVHRRCATYRVRTRASGGSRLGFPG